MRRTADTQLSAQAALAGRATEHRALHSWSGAAARALRAVSTKGPGLLVLTLQT